MLGRVLGEDIILEFSYENDLPAVKGDPGMLEQVILNLAVNARDAMPLGGRLHISTSTVNRTSTPSSPDTEIQPGTFVRLVVGDTGCGIPPGIRDRIFEPFFTTKDVGKGTGLGLATVYGIITQHRGWIEVDTNIGEGTTFIIHLPANPVSESELTDPPAVSSERGQGETILVVEDEIAVRELICYTLERHGYKVLVASSGAEVGQFSRAQLETVDLLVTDMVMPGGVNGRELAESLRRDYPRLKIIYCSGYSPEIAGGRLAIEHGVAFIQKPFTLPGILSAVADSLRA
jgi:CheY-like chemotaxis protein